MEGIRVIYETIEARVRGLPSDLANVFDEICHVAVDFYERLTITITLMISLFQRDMIEFQVFASGKSATDGYILLSETYFWSSFCLLAYDCGEIVGGSTILGSVLERVMSRLNAFFLGAAMLPLFVHTLLRKSLSSDDTRRTWTFVSAFLVGLFLNYSNVISDDIEKEIWTPPIFVFPFFMGWMCSLAAYYNIVGSMRIVLILLCLIVPCLFCTAVSAAFHRFDTVFLKWALTCSLMSTTGMQLKIGRLKRRWACESLEQWATTLTFIAGRLLFRLFLLLGLGER